MTTPSAVTRQEALDTLKKHGIEEAEIYLIDVIPLIEMIWADGMAQEGEIAILDDFIPGHVQRINEMAAYPVLSIEKAHRFVKRFLQKRPDPDILRTLRNLVKPIRLSSSDRQTNREVSDSLLAICLDIASSAVSSNHNELKKRFNLDEKRCFFEILESMEDPQLEAVPPVV
jgi:hypothetical protein